MSYDPTLDHAAVVATARTAPGRPPLGTPLTPQQGAEVCRDAVCALRALGEDAALLAGKSEGQNHGVIDGVRVAVDVIAYPSGGGQHFDCLTANGSGVWWHRIGPYLPPLYAYVPSGCESVEPPDEACCDVCQQTLDLSQRHYDEHGWALGEIMADLAAIKAKLGI